MLSPKLEVGQSAIAGMGFFAKEAISAGELLWEADQDAPLISLSEWFAMPHSDRSYYSQYDDNRLVLNNQTEWPWNHSCDPNCVCKGRRIQALRDIASGEEVTYDYGFSEIARDWKITCHCSMPLCRGTVSNQDFLIKGLQQRYHGHIPPYVQRAIARSGANGTVPATAREKSWL